MAEHDFLDDFFGAEAAAAPRAAAGSATVPGSTARFAEARVRPLPAADPGGGEILLCVSSTRGCARACGSLGTMLPARATRALCHSCFVLAPIPRR